MTGTPCCVRVCHSNTKFTRNVTWHEFPTDERMRRIWIERVRKMRQHKTWLPQPYTKICGFHFNKSGFKTEADRIPVYIGRLRKKKFNSLPLYRNGPQIEENIVEDEVFNEHSYFRKKMRPPLKKPPPAANRNFHNPVRIPKEVPMLTPPAPVLTPPASAQKTVLRTERKLVPVNDILVKYLQNKSHTPRFSHSRNNQHRKLSGNNREANTLFLPEAVLTPTESSSDPQTSNPIIQNKVPDPLEGEILNNGEACENNFVSVKSEVEEDISQQMDEGDPLDLELSSEDDTLPKYENDTMQKYEDVDALRKENSSLKDENQKLVSIIKKLRKDLSESLQREEKYIRILSSTKLLSIKLNKLVNMKIETDSVQVKQEFDC